jgi:hypothetical protein
VNAVDATTAVGPASDEIDITQDPQVFRGLGLWHAEQVDEFSDGRFANGECVQDVASARVTDCVEDIGVRPLAGHVTIIF